MRKKVALIALQVAAAVLVIGVHQAFAQGIDLGPLNRLMDSLGCALRTFGPYLAFLFGIIGLVLIVASSSRGIHYLAYAIFGIAAVAAFPRILSSIASMFGLSVTLSCR